jgi:hypothetical protein
MLLLVRASGAHRDAGAVPRQRCAARWRRMCASSRCPATCRAAASPRCAATLLASADAATTLTALGGANQAALARETAIVVRDANYTWSVCEATVLIDTLDLTAESPTARRARRTSRERVADRRDRRRNDCSSVQPGVCGSWSSRVVDRRRAAATALAPQSSAGSSTIEVHGCVECRPAVYTIHMGQQIVGSSRTWSLRLVTSVRGAGAVSHHDAGAPQVARGRADWRASCRRRRASACS